MPLAQAAWKLPMRPLRVAGLRVRRKVLDRSGIELLERRAQQGEHGLRREKKRWRGPGVGSPARIPHAPVACDARWVEQVAPERHAPGTELANVDRGREPPTCGL